jgi:3-phenylpropionate/cinnamic acid dioxygenase small subunit
MSETTVKDGDRCRITDIIHRYFWLADHGHAEQIAGLFAQHGRLIFSESAPKPGVLTGRPEIATAMLARSKQTHVTTRHVVSNIMMRSRDAMTIEASSLLTLYRSEDESRDSYPKSIADIEDVFVREGDEWRIGQRTIDPIFNRP